MTRVKQAHNLETFPNYIHSGEVLPWKRGMVFEPSSLEVGCHLVASGSNKPMSLLEFHTAAKLNPKLQ